MTTRITNFWDLAAGRPHALAIIEPYQAEWTAGDLLAEANRIANGLRSLGVRRGDVVGVLMPTCGELIAILLATYQVGMYALLLNPRFTATELRYQLDDAEADVLIVQTSATAADVLSSLVIDTERLNISLGFFSGYLDYHEVFSKAVGDMPNDRIAGSILSYTSGTTGRPKAVLRQLGVGSPESALAPLIRWFVESFNVDANERNVQLSCCPIYFTGPAIHALYAVHLGHPLVLLKHWNPRIALSLIARYAVTTAFMVPFHFHSLLQLPASERLRNDISSLRRVIHGGAPCPLEIKRAMLDWLGERIYETYGATEVGTTQSSPHEWRQYPGTVGRASPPHEIRILNSAGRSVNPGVVGRVFLREGALNRFEYKGDPEKTAASRIGAFVTAGDLGYLNEAGFLFLCDRRDDLIICRGENIYPAEVDASLALHANVVDCGCFGLSHPEWGQQVALAVQWHGSAANDNERLASILRHMRERLSPHKLPTIVRFVQQIPRDGSGKLRRAELSLIDGVECPCVTHSLVTPERRP